MRLTKILMLNYAALVLLIAGAAIYAVIVYHGLVRLQNEMGRAWANIDVLLKQRHDEVPNLVACVKGYMDHERQTLEAVTQARAASMNAGSIPQTAQSDLLMTGALRSFFAVAEGYPQLKANQSFLVLNWKNGLLTAASFSMTTSIPTTRALHSCQRSLWRG